MASEAIESHTGVSNIY